MINRKLLEMIGFHEVSSAIMSGFNLFKIVSMVEILILILTAFLCSINIFNCLDDINEVTKFSLLIVAVMITCFKLHCIIQNSEKIWNCIRSTSIDSLLYEYHSMKTLRTGQANSKQIAIFILCLRVAVVMSWALSPFSVKGYYVQRQLGNSTQFYRYNTGNFVFPATGEFYNNHFKSFYCFETALFIFWGHGNMTFDTILVLMIISISYQLKTITDSYSTFTIKHEHVRGKTLIAILHESTNLIVLMIIVTQWVPLKKEK